MRFKALNQFTDKLPKLSLNEDYVSVTGTDTKESVLSGVQTGIINEVEGYIKHFREKYSDLKVIFTGGNTFFFENSLKSEIFADPYLVLKGLNVILKYNV
jgi:type III pantothenate kinase